MDLSSDNAALIVVDMQNSFCTPEGACGKIGLPIEKLFDAIEPCERLVAAARAAGIPVIFTQYVYRSDYLDGGVMVKHLIPDLKTHAALAAGSWDAEILPQLAPADGEPVVVKNRPSAFYNTNLETILNGLGAKQLVVCGVTTNCCVESTVRDASHRDYETFVVQDAVAEVDDERHGAALKSMAMLFAKLVTVDEVTASWPAAQAAE